MNISIFGTGYVGLVTGSGLADLGHTVLCIDSDELKIRKIQERTIPFYEPGLENVVFGNVEKKRLSFTTNLKAGAAFGDVIFSCVGTPSTADGSANLESIFSIAELVAQQVSGDKVLVNKSTVPPGTARHCHDIIQASNPHSLVRVASNPEFLAEGKAVHDFKHPDKIVVGAIAEEIFPVLRRVYTGRIRTYIPFVETDWETAEMIKYANNSFLATKISFINEIANICDVTGADVKIVAQALGMDYRINPRFLSPGVGYGGSCFPKDVRALIWAAEEQGYTPGLLQEVHALNERQKKIIISKLQHVFGDSLPGRIITVWGASFKPNTSDVREAPVLSIISELLAQNCAVSLYDPRALDEIKSLFGDAINYTSSLEGSVQGSSAILLVTEWDEFRGVSFSKLGTLMREKVLLDGRNIYEPELVREEGFRYFGVGRR